MKRKERKVDRQERDAGQKSAGAKGKPPIVSQGRLFALAMVILLLAFIAGAVLYKNQKSDATFKAYQSNKSIFVRNHSPSFGNPAAKVEIVEFFDPACETCREFYPLVKKMMASNPDRIRLFARYAPFHTGSDAVVRILEAARRQGKFWETLEAVFAAQPNWAPNHRPQPELVWNYIGSVGLDIERLRQDLNAPDIDAVIQQDLADAKALKVSMTPEFFVNGMPLPGWGYEQLKTLVSEALSSARD